MTQIHILSTSTSADLERLDSPYMMMIFFLEEKDNFRNMYSHEGSLLGSFAEPEKYQIKSS